MSYARLEELGGIQWPCWDEEHPGEQFIHGRLWDDVVAEPAPFMAVEHSPPVDVLDDDFPLRLTTGRRLESFNTGVQTGRLLVAAARRRRGAARLARGRRALRARRRRPRARHLAARRDRGAGRVRRDAAARASRS